MVLGKSFSCRTDLGSQRIETIDTIGQHTLDRADRIVAAVDARRSLRLLVFPRRLSTVSHARSCCNRVREKAPRDLTPRNSGSINAAAAAAQRAKLTQDESGKFYRGRTDGIQNWFYR